MNSHPVARENYREFLRLLDFLIKVGITPKKFHIVQFNQVNGRVNNASAPDYTNACNCTNERWLVEAIIFLREEILKRGFPNPKPGPASCMVEFAIDLVINVDSASYKCPAFVGREEFAVGDLRNGVVNNLDAYNTAVWKKQECLDCAYLPQCFGGCRFLKFLRDGNIDSVDCWNDFLDAILESCNMQDLKYRPKNQ